MKIYDCTIFLDENLMFEVRLNTLDKYVDKFVVVESLYTHAGNKKKKNFDIDRYKKYKDKIIYILIDEEPEDLLTITNDSDEYLGHQRINTLKRIRLQYNALSEGIIGADKNDLIIVSDIDEIPNLETLEKKIENKILLFQQRLYYYKFNLLYQNYKWFGSKACKKKDLINFEWLKYIKNKKYNLFRLDILFSKNKYINVKIIENGGWHFSKVKNEEDIFYLLSNYGEHNEFEKSGLLAKDYKEFINQGVLPYDHFLDKKSSIENKFSKRIKLEKNNDKLPNYLLQNLEKYKDWFA
jgi:beta-1,4-mannosyl-glycoprotein beta-1,4-N-acetylglucosaminyltransferase